MTVLILHGIQGYAGIHWQQWLHDQLVSQGTRVLMPDLPHSGHPDRLDWLSFVKRLVDRESITDQLSIVGHSLGIVTALDFIEQCQIPIRALISVSGFAADYGLELNSYFLNAKYIDFFRVRRNILNSFVLYSDNDPYVTPQALQFLAQQLQVQPEIIPGGGHFNNDSGYTTFPRILEIINSLG